MYLQQEVQYDGKKLTGCDSNLQMCKSILCFMSGGRFLVSPKEVYHSESILKLKTFLSNNIELTSNIASIPDEESSILQDFLVTVNQENFDHITISQDAVDVITFVLGYISRSLINSLDCEECKIARTDDPVSSTYLDNYNRGGLEIPTSALNSYTQCAFFILDHLEQRILEVDVPSKVLAQSILNKLSSEWDDFFVGHNHSMVGRQKVNSIVSNCYSKNLAKDVTETRRRDQVKEFKRMKIAADK